MPWRQISALILLSMAHPVVSEDVWDQDRIPRVSCDIVRELTKDGRKESKEMRAKALPYCLACKGDSCAMKVWPKDKSSESTLCKRLFCSPIRRSKPLIDDDNIGSFTTKFDFIINTKGRGQLVRVTELEGDFANPVGGRPQSPEQAHRTVTRQLERTLKRTRFEPLVIDGKKGKIVNLSGAINIQSSVEPR